jgi:hypothetical protein
VGVLSARDQALLRSMYETSLREFQNEWEQGLALKATIWINLWQRSGVGKGDAKNGKNIAVAPSFVRLAAMDYSTIKRGFGLGAVGTILGFSDHAPDCRVWLS